jgi:hypothetical protein
VSTTGLTSDAGSFHPLGGVLETSITHIRALGTTVGVTEIAFDTAPISESEYTKLVTQCFAIEKSPSLGGVGSTAGICKCDPKKAT